MIQRGKFQNKDYCEAVHVRRIQDSCQIQDRCLR